VAIFSARFAEAEPLFFACSDTIDNDGDGYTDYPSDPGCTSLTDTDEYNTFVLPEGNIKVKFMSSSLSISDMPGDDDDTGIFEINVSIKVIGEDAYISHEYSLSSDSEYNLGRLAGGGILITSGASHVMTTSADESAAGNYQIEEGEAETFTFTISYTKTGGSPDGLYQAFLKQIKWNNDDENDFDDYYNKSLDADIFKTDSVILN